MKSAISTTHINYNGRFYFLLIEKIGGIVFSLWSIIILSVLYLLLYSLFDRDIPSDINWWIALFSTPIILSIVYFFIWPAYSRARFLRNKGYCLITPEEIESHCLGKVKQYEYKNRSIKTKVHKDGSVDIFIGKSFKDSIKHSGFVFTPKFYKANKALRGLGAPLYRVTNADEVVSYLEANK